MSSFFSVKPLVASGSSSQPLQPVVRYGRVYKRKPPDHSWRSNRALSISQPGFRMCRMCNKQLPLDQFYEGTKRYVCKQHHYQMVLRTTIKRFGECPYERVAWMSWLALHRVCPLLGYKHVNYDRHDLLDLMKATQIPLSCKPRAVPLDPRHPLFPRNVAVVSLTHMTLLMRVFEETASVAHYLLMVQRCNLLPETADVGRPREPFHDPQYRRAYVDVAPLLAQEPHAVRPMVEAAWAAEAEARKKAAALLVKQAEQQQPKRKKKKKPLLEEEPAPKKPRVKKMAQLLKPRPPEAI
jgi:hypothetical protein